MGIAKLWQAPALCSYRRGLMIWATIHLRPPNSIPMPVSYLCSWLSFSESVYFCSAEIQHSAIFHPALTSANKGESTREASFLMKWEHTTHLEVPDTSTPERQKPCVCSYVQYITLCTSFQIFLTGQVLQSKFLKSKVAIFSVV